MPYQHPGDEQLDKSTSRWMLWGAVLGIVFVAAFPAYRLLEPGRRAGSVEAYTVELTAQGAEIYELNCSSCHGPEGGGGLAPGLFAKEFLQQAEDEQIRQLVSVGVPGTQMGSYLLDFGGPLTHTQIDAVVAFLRSQEEDAPSFPQWRTPLAQEDLTGRELYTMGCASCHLTDLSGDVGPALGPGSEATEESDARLARRIEIGKDEMPGFGNILNDDQIASIVAYIREFQESG